MSGLDVESIRQVKTLPSLIKLLREKLDWPIEADEIEDITFEYRAEELGLDAKHAANIKEIQQLRPLDTNQPWGIFWINFEKKRLPMVVLRRILGNLVIKRRASARKADRPSWHLHDLLFISAYGEEEHRTVSFAHFTENAEPDELPVLRVLGWDDQNSIMHLDRVVNRLQSHFRWPSNPKDVGAWRQRWSEAFTDRYREAIRSADELIPRLASLASAVRGRVRAVLEAETERGPMRRIFAAVQELLIHDMNEDGFADMYAQTVAYGLLSAQFSRPAGLTAQNLVQLTAVSNPFLENLLGNLFRLNRGKFQFDVDEVGINDVLDLLRNTNIEAIKAAFNDLNPAEDPVIRFYQDFLQEYDAKQRVKRGVFFTPRPVVSYIVRSVHKLLQTAFGLEDGLASTATWADMLKRFPDLQLPKDVKPDDPFVCILDPAVGTATFLYECIEVIERTVKTKWARSLGKREPDSSRTWCDPEIHARWRDYVSTHLLPRLYGFEIMMAPYAIAHLKLALKLGETGYQFRDGDRLNIYLTNTLEPPSDIANAKLADLFGPLAREAQEVNHAKRHKRFTIVIGNPPYAGIASNMTEYAQHIVDAYKVVDGAALNEKKLWLQDDYVKFIRKAQMLIDQTGVGVLGYITNHGYLDNPTFRGMRQSIMNTFPHLRLIDLHGNTTKNEQSPDGSDDKNVFDIKLGVAVCLATRVNRETSVEHCDVWGMREMKYAWLIKHDVTNTDFSLLAPDSPYYFFAPRDESTRDEYAAYLPITAILPKYVSAPVTARDHFVIAISKSDLLERMTEFRSQRLSDEDVREKYFTGHTRSTKYPPGDSRGWKLPNARDRCRKDSDWKARVIVCSYRAFDDRYAYWTEWMVDWPRPELVEHVIGHENICLVTRRQMLPGNTSYFIVTNHLPVDGILRSDNKGGESVFPLFLTEGGFLTRSTRMQMCPNIADVAVQRFAGCTGLRWTNESSGDLRETFGARDVLGYLYAIFFSPSYRHRYEDQIRVDFPRVPLPKSAAVFDRLVVLGNRLVHLHLLSDHTPPANGVKWVGSESCVESVSWSNDSVWIDRAQEAGFTGVGEATWLFQVGAHQVCEKWLKDRKGRRLSAHDITHYQKIVAAISETICIMGEIDRVIEEHGGWPDAFATEQLSQGSKGGESPPFA